MHNLLADAPDYSIEFRLIFIDEEIMSIVTHY